VAGYELLCQTEIALIAAFQVISQASSFDSPESKHVPDFNQASFKQVYEGLGSFSGGHKLVNASYADEGELQALKIEGEDFCVTDLSTRHIHLLGDNKANEISVAEIILGPPLLCIMALDNLFSFHAGAVNTQQGAALFIGESGRGKSTLSQEALGQDWQRLGDDIMPTFMVGEGQRCCLQPRFPQLKRETQILDKGIVPLSRHIASSRVFSPQLLAKKMAFISSIVNQVSIVDLSYRREINELETLRSEIVGHLTEA